MLGQLQQMGSELGTMASTVDPLSLTPKEARAWLVAANAVERHAVAIKTLVADRAADTADWARGGYRSPEDWLAQTTGTTYGEAVATLDASAKLGELPGLDQAVRAGELSGPQLREIARAATPENEQRLLGAARRESLRELRKTCGDERARARSAEEEQARHERIHRERFHRSWTDADGAYRYEGKATAAVGARIDAAVEAEAEGVFKEAYAEGRREAAAAYRVDALERLVTGGGANVDTTVVIRVDAAAMAGGEGMCKTSAGSVPVDGAIGAVLAGAFVKVVLTDGVDITHVAHPGRRRPAVLDTAVFERDRYACVRPGCGATQRLQVHHYRVDYADRGPTAYWNLATLCRHDHDLVTHGGHRLGGGPGNWTWIPPPG